ncbi:hypothetical protein EYC80_002632 [Monilinia laxa]|uniref:Uncharacterized protein n=1 Tax=Monilinia laxa TaxID=61186 RepID=A0A5N6K4J4_MONLA|nr:hypothetical protein EYC80_002632 [Monilinia laxa]
MPEPKTLRSSIIFPDYLHIPAITPKFSFFNHYPLLIFLIRSLIIFSSIQKSKRKIQQDLRQKQKEKCVFNLVPVILL